MKRDVEMGTVVTAEDVEKEGTSRNGNTNAGGVGECGEHGKTVLEVCETLNGVHCAQWWSSM